VQFSSKYPCGPDEYCLSKDTDVALWLDYRRFQKEPCLTDYQDFVVVNSQLHDQFDLFRNSLNAENSLLPMCELLIFYCASQRSQLLSSKVVKYGNIYLDVHYSEVDKLVFWVDEMRERYYGLEGEEIFKNAAQIMFSNYQAGKILQGIIIILYKINY
jgi:hypothetical protein